MTLKKIIVTLNEQNCEQIFNLLITIILNCDNQFLNLKNKRRGIMRF